MDEFFGCSSNWVMNTYATAAQWTPGFFVENTSPVVQCGRNNMHGLCVC